MARDDGDAPCSGGELAGGWTRYVRCDDVVLCFGKDLQVSLSLVALEPLMIIGSVVKHHKPWIDGKNEGCMHDEKLDGGGDPRRSKAAAVAPSQSPLQSEPPRAILLRPVARNISECNPRADLPEPPSVARRWRPEHHFSLAVFRNPDGLASWLSVVGLSLSQIELRMDNLADNRPPQENPSNLDCICVARNLESLKLWGVLMKHSPKWDVFQNLRTIEIVGAKLEDPVLTMVQGCSWIRVPETKHLRNLSISNSAGRVYMIDFGSLSALEFLSMRGVQWCWDAICNMLKLASETKFLMQLKLLKNNLFMPPPKLDLEWSLTGEATEHVFATAGHAANTAWNECL
ncbi:F-box protein [Sesbania bispinosa]|nr:F-box protein [Sesbania bispinosa]